MAKVYKPEDIKMSNFVFSDPVKEQSRYITETCYREPEDGKKNTIYLQTPKLVTQSFIRKVGNDYYIDFAVPASFEKFLAKIDKTFISAIQTHSKDWYNCESDVTLKQVQAAYKSAVDQKSGKFRVKLEKDEENNLDICVYDQWKDVIDTDSVTAKQDAVVILKLGGIWQGRNYCGPEWTVVQMKVRMRESKASLPECVISEDQKPTFETPADDCVYLDTETDPEETPFKKKPVQNRKPKVKVMYESELKKKPEPEEKESAEELDSESESEEDEDEELNEVDEDTDDEESLEELLKLKMLLKEKIKQRSQQQKKR